MVPASRTRAKLLQRSHELRNAVAVATDGCALASAAWLQASLQTTPYWCLPSFASTANAFWPFDVALWRWTSVLSRTTSMTSALVEAIHSFPEARALVVVDLFGNTAGTDEAIATARQHGMVVIEDAAQAIGAHSTTGEPIGRRADVTTFSLYTTKNVFAGEGGVVVSPSKEIADRIRALSDHQTIEVDGRRLIGLNYRMNELGAALSLTQMPSLAEFVQCRHERAGQLADACAEAWTDTVRIPNEAAELEGFGVSAPRVSPVHRHGPR